MSSNETPTVDLYDAPESVPFSYKWWVKNSQRVLGEAEQYNAWREEALHTALAIFSPKLATLGRQFYCGCGFHYYKIGQLSKLLANLMYPWQPSANHLDKLENDWLMTTVTEVIFKALEEDICTAEQCIEERTKTGKCNCLVV